MWYLVALYGPYTHIVVTCRTMLYVIVPYIVFPPEVEQCPRMDAAWLKHRNVFFFRMPCSLSVLIRYRGSPQHDDQKTDFASPVYGKRTPYNKEKKNERNHYWNKMR